MGKTTVHVVTVPRWVTVTLLIAVSAAMALLILLLSGKAYLRERTSVVEVISFVRRYDRLTPSAFIAGVAPVITDMLFFMPWGALAFLSFDRAGRGRWRTYALTIAVGVAFASLLVAWQSALPTRVTGWNDAAWNAAGCLAGAMGAHVRKRLRIRFE